MTSNNEEVKTEDLKIETVYPETIPFVEQSYGLGSQELDGWVAIRNLSVSLNYCIAKRTTNQTLNDATETDIGIDTYETNNGTMDDTAGSIKIATTGTYIIHWCIRYNTDATWIRTIALYKNSSTINWIYPTNVKVASSLTDIYTHISVMTRLTKGDLIKMTGYQDRWWTLAVLANYTYLEVTQIS